uniref:Uncharacterized protein n=1 Tax=Physcomitrium patens TaxID=3218 RepID=A0A2K1L6R2_PHYPA|nr:hypothetical protein PHYPA_000140 [Physcomitrium patens]
MEKKTTKTLIQRVEDEDILDTDLQSIQVGHEPRPRQRAVKKKSVLEEEISNP